MQDPSSTLDHRGIQTSVTLLPLQVLDSRQAHRLNQLWSALLRACKISSAVTHDGSTASSLARLQLINISIAHGCAPVFGSTAWGQHADSTTMVLGVPQSAMGRPKHVHDVSQSHCLMHTV